MVVITRSKARATLNRQSTEVIVSPSATGKGTHVRWKYPENRAYVEVPPLRMPPARKESSGDESRGDTSDTLSSLTSLSSSTDASFHTAVQTQTQTPQFPFPGTNPNPSRNPITPANTMPLTPPRHAPRKLQRSPPGHSRWVQQNDGSMRLVLVPDSFEEEEIMMRESILDLRLEEIAQRELRILQKQREAARRAGFGMRKSDEDEAMEALMSGEYVEMETDSSEASGMDSDTDESFQGGGNWGGASRHRLSFVREDTEPADDIPQQPVAGPSRLGRHQPLVAHDTEIFDPRTVTPRRQFIR